MKLSYSLHEKHAAKFFNFLILGVLYAVDKKLISIDEAEGYIFKPNLHKLLKKLNASKELIEVAKLGCELDDVADIAPEHYQESLDEMIEKALSAIQDSEEVGRAVLEYRKIELGGTDRKPTVW
ncbi:DUF3969 family protein [Xenorhabdus sp. XENO-10]|uniref:DUF3969 family protein n=1 Tax=Xenorhabdus yunnanensis TaxID=3025878 RepID=A0ABT5LL56_9GAMM|nr:DUF3969 family protein [Xenorhabdus yunnanensis]MDC9591740.1 DUF3969 family protein [Xenorhabdus yunnanensis]